MSMEFISGVAFCVEESIKTKLILVGATSYDKAASSRQAHFDLQEENWIHYIAGGLFSKVKKTAGTGGAAPHDLMAARGYSLSSSYHEAYIL